MLVGIGKTKQDLIDQVLYSGTRHRSQCMLSSLRISKVAEILARLRCLFTEPKGVPMQLLLKVIELVFSSLPSLAHCSPLLCSLL